MAMSERNLGNTVVRDQVTFWGFPFSSHHVNSNVLSQLFPEGEVIPPGSETEVKKSVVKFKGISSPEGTPLFCEVRTDSILVQCLLSPQPLEQLAKHISVAKDFVDKIQGKLQEAHSIPKALEIQSRNWTAATQSVPCVKWLKKQSLALPDAFALQSHLEKGWTFDWRPVCARFGLQLFPPKYEELPEQVKRELESSSVIEVSVDTPEEWRNGTGTVTATFRHIDTAMYCNVIALVTS